MTFPDWVDGDLFRWLPDATHASWPSMADRRVPFIPAERRAHRSAMGASAGGRRSLTLAR
jgi:hypothetical protein